MVHGEARPYAVALVVPTDATVTDADVEAAIVAANQRLPDYAQVRRWARAPEPFTLQNGLLTSNGRLRRDAILARHGALLAPLYDRATHA
jgi:long-subunit acyl-CoA synthetase (AMP-forming)